MEGTQYRSEYPLAPFSQWRSVSLVAPLAFVVHRLKRRYGGGTTLAAAPDGSEQMPEQETRTSEETRAPEGAATANELFQAARLLFGWNTDLMRFYAQRVVRYGELPLRLLACTNASDLQRLQADFLRQLTDEYRGEAARLSRITGEADVAAAEELDAEYASRLRKAQEDAARIIEEAKAQAARIVAAAQEQVEPPAEQPEKLKKRA